MISDKNLQRDPVSGALINTDLGGLAERRAKKLQHSKINKIEEVSSDNSKRLDKIEQDLSTILTMLREMQK